MQYPDVWRGRLTREHHAIDSNHALIRIGLSSKRGYVAINGDTARGDQRLRRSTAAVPRSREDLLETFHGHALSGECAR